MVRHEAAEALGGIATPDVLPHLREWMNREDAPRVVRESCQIAIDMWEVCSLLFLLVREQVTETYYVPVSSMKTLVNSNTPMHLDLLRLLQSLRWVLFMTLPFISILYHHDVVSLCCNSKYLSFFRRSIQPLFGTEVRTI